MEVIRQAAAGVTVQLAHSFCPGMGFLAYIIFQSIQMFIYFYFKRWRMENHKKKDPEGGDFRASQMTFGAIYICYLFLTVLILVPHKLSLVLGERGAPPSYRVLHFSLQWLLLPRYQALGYAGFSSDGA